MYAIIFKTNAGWTWDGPFLTNRGANKVYSRFADQPDTALMHKHEIKSALKNPREDMGEDFIKVLKDALEAMRIKKTELDAARPKKTPTPSKKTTPNQKWSDNALVPLNLTRADIRDMIHFMATHNIHRTKGTPQDERRQESWKEFMSAKAWWMYEFFCSQGLRIAAKEVVEFITLQIDPPGGVPAGLDEHMRANRKAEGWKMTDRVWSSNSYKP